MKTIQYSKQKGSNNAYTVIEHIKMWLNDATNGQYIVRFERAKRPRSNQQNRLMWVWFQCIAQSWSEATGKTFTAQIVHDVYCRLFLPIDTPRGIIAGHTSGLDTEDMTDFLNKVKADAAAEYGIQLLSYEDMMYEVWAAQYQE